MGKDFVVMGWDCLVALHYRRAEVGAQADGSYALPEVAVGCVGAHPTVAPFGFYRSSGGSCRRFFSLS